MTLFLVIIVLMSLLAGAVLAFSVRHARAQDIDRTGVNVALFRERRAELDAEREAGRLDDARHAALLAELEQMLVDDVGVPVATAAPASVGFWRALIVGALVPVLALPFYLGGGLNADERAWLDLGTRSDEAARLPPPLSAELASRQGFAPTDLARLVQAGLDRRAVDADAWLQLASLWLETQVPGPAVESLRTARRLAPERVDILGALVQVELALNRNRLNDDIRALFEELLTRQPGHQGALMVYGMAAFESGDYATAVRRWEELLAQIDGKSEGAVMLRQSIARAKDAQAGKGVAAAVGIPVRVELGAGAPALPATAALFVIVRAAGGPPMPLAAKKLPVHFPAEVVVSDADQMMAGTPLAERGALEIVARVSLTGQPKSAPGDLESAPRQVTLPVDAPVILTLDRRLP